MFDDDTFAQRYSTPSGDDQLFALIAEHERREQAIEESGLDEDEVARRCDYSREVEQQIEAIRPTTLRGVLALLDYHSNMYEDRFEPGCAVIEALRDMVARGNHVDPSAMSDGDATALSLFRQWIAATHQCDRQIAEDPDAEGWPAQEVMWNLEDRIFATSGGAVALAVKTYFEIYQEHAAWTEEGAALLRIIEVFSEEAEDVSYAVSKLRDAAAIVPEIGELAAPVLHEDAALIEAEIEIKWCRGRLAEPDNPVPKIVECMGAEWEAETRRNNRREVERRLETTLARIDNTEAKTERGRAVKARLGIL